MNPKQRQLAALWTVLFVPGAAVLAVVSGIKLWASPTGMLGWITDACQFGGFLLLLGSVSPASDFVASLRPRQQAVILGGVALVGVVAAAWLAETAPGSFEMLLLFVALVAAVLGGTVILGVASRVVRSRRGDHTANNAEQ